MIHRRTLALIGALALALLLGSCGGGKSFKNGQVRLVNLTGAALDLRVGGAVIAGNVAAGAASAYVDREEGTTTFELGEPGNSGVALSIETTIDDDLHYSVIAYTTGGALAAVATNDDTGKPGGGKAVLRLFNASREAGALDLFATATSASLSGATPTNDDVAVQAFGTYTLINPGTYRLRVTSATDSSDVRLDIPAVALAEGQLVTLIVQASDSGLLVNGTRLDQGGAPTAHPNDSVRLSVVADRLAGTPVDVELDGSLIVSALPSPGVTPYRTVALASLPTLKVGSAVPDVSNAKAGTDLTLFVAGDGTAPVLMEDNNRLPGSASRSRLRLAHGINGHAGALTVDQSSLVLEEALAFGTFSEPFEITPGTNVSLRVRTVGQSCTVPTFGPATLVAGGVYTLFALGECGGATLVLRQDR